MSKKSKCRSKSSGRCDCCESGGCDCGCRRGCSCGAGFRRRYQTNAEQIAELEKYLEDLKAEVQAAGEKLADLKRKK